jgi:hypothetical protein
MKEKRQEAEFQRCGGGDSRQQQLICDNPCTPLLHASNLELVIRNLHARLDSGETGGTLEWHSRAIAPK